MDEQNKPSNRWATRWAALVALSGLIAALVVATFRTNNDIIDVWCESIKGAFGGAVVGMALSFAKQWISP